MPPLAHLFLPCKPPPFPTLTALPPPQPDGAAHTPFIYPSFTLLTPTHFIALSPGLVPHNVGYTLTGMNHPYVTLLHHLISSDLHFHSLYLILCTALRSHPSILINSPPSIGAFSLDIAGTAFNSVSTPGVMSLSLGLLSPNLKSPL